MNRREARQVSKFNMPDDEFLQHCQQYMKDARQPEEWIKELYCIADAVMAQFNITYYHGIEKCNELRQDCLLRFFSYTIPRMVNTSSMVAKISAHSYVYQSAYFLVLQFVNKFRTRAAKFSLEQANDMLQQMAFEKGRRKVAVDVTAEEAIVAKVGK